MKDETLIVCIIDRSTSMGSIKSQTIEGFNEFIRKQKELETPAKVYTVLFDGMIKYFITPGDKEKPVYEIIHNMLPIKDVQFLTDKQYIPQGWTAMNDAIGKTIDDIGNVLKNTIAEERPSKVVVMVLTDGEENCSTEYDTKKLKEMIEHQKSKYSWDFLFLGANIDAERVGDAIGIGEQHSYTYNSTAKGIKTTFNAAAEYAKSMRVGTTLDRAVMYSMIKDDSETTSNTNQ